MKLYVVASLFESRHNCRRTAARTKRQRSWRAALLVIVLILQSTRANASFLSEITGIDINVPAGTISFHAPHPEAIPEMLKNLPQDIMYALNPAGQQLAFLIRQAQAQAQPGSQPIPPVIRETLKAFFPAYILDKARWNIYDAGRHTLDSVILGTDCSGLFGQWGLDCKMGAITLDQTIVFRGQHEAETNWYSWAHELVHVSQYDSMGVDGFAFVYASPGFYSLEKQAYDWQNTVAAALRGPVIVQARWTVAPGPRSALRASDFSNAVAKVTSDPSWRNLHAGWGQSQDCLSLSPGTDTGIAATEASAHFARGQSYEKSGNWVAAAAEYQEASRLNFTDAMAFDRLGVALTRLGKADEGVRHLKRAICLDQSRDAFRRDLASALMLSSDTNRAIAEYQLAIYANPTSALLHRELAAAYKKQGDTESALIEQFAAEQLDVVDGGSLYSSLRQHLISDWSEPQLQVNADGYYRTHWTLARLDSCMLAWSERGDATHSGKHTVQMMGYSIELRQINTEDVRVTSVHPAGWTLDIKDAKKIAITLSMGSQMPSGRMTLPVLYKPDHAWLMGMGSEAEANEVLTLLRPIIAACSSKDR